MTFIPLLLLLVVVGVLLPFIPMDAKIRQLVIAIIAILALLWLFAVFAGYVETPHRIRMT